MARKPKESSKGSKFVGTKDDWTDIAGSKELVPGSLYFNHGNGKMRPIPAKGADVVGVAKDANTLVEAD